MLARLQQAVVLGAILATLSAMVWLAHRFGMVAGIAAAAIVPLGYAAVLALEFGWMACCNRSDPAPSATWREMVGAWWGEVRSGPRVFGWRQPFASRHWPDLLTPSAAGRRGVLFVHGFVCNRGLWNPWLERLSADGVVFEAVNLEPVFGSIDDYIATVEAAVRRLERLTGLPPIVVAHSMGGLVVRRWWAACAHAPRLHHVITLGTPHQGTWLARFALSQNAKQMRPGSPWMKKLSELEPSDLGQRFTCFYSHCDNIVFPASTATLSGADNRHLRGVAHVHMADHPAPFQELLRHLRD